MNLNTLAIVALALLPFHLSFGMEKTSNLAIIINNQECETINIPLTFFTTLPSLATLQPAQKKYFPLILPDTIDWDLFILETECFLDITSDLYETLPEEGFREMKHDFLKKFGYPIPTSVDDYKKRSFESNLTDKKVFENLEKMHSQKSPQVTIKTSTTKVKKNVNRDRNEQKKLRAREKKADLEKLCHERETENERLIKVNKELTLIAKEKEKAQKAIAHEEKRQHIIAAQKRDREAKATQKKSAVKQPVQHPKKNILTQKRFAKSTLIKRNNCQTEAQLKTVLSQFCFNTNAACMGYRISPNSAFHYDHKTNELIILIGEEIDTYDCCDYEG